MFFIQVTGLAMDYQQETDVPQSPRKTKRGKRPRSIRVVVIVVLVLLMLIGGVASYAYYYFEANIQGFLSTMIHPVQRGKDEPQLDAAIPSNSSVSGRVWNILLLGSDDDQKFNFPAILTR
jgi:polyisoprenyl-teichoic acid--peptidoglycan teichoic acid transferase